MTREKKIQIAQQDFVDKMEDKRIMIEALKFANTELDVLQLISIGMRNVDIAETLNISPNTSAHYRQTIHAKLETNNSVQAMLTANYFNLI